jgi:hypothetical protein
MKRVLIVSVMLLLAALPAASQVFTNKELGKKNAELIDSLKKAEYPYVLPIWGQKATSRGYNLPYSAGISVQYFGQESDLIIENLKVGFNEGPLYDLDGLVRFDKARAAASAVTVRPDIWVFPFLNLYAILGRSQASTDVGFGVWIPDSNNVDNEILSASTKINFNASTFGLGVTPTIGVGGGFLALDMNLAWTDVPQLKKPAMTFVFGPRFGKNFKLKDRNKTLAVWVGGFRVKLNSETAGSIALSDVLPVDELGSRIETGMEKVGNAQEQVDTWWADLTDTERKNPINAAKYERANSILQRAGQLLVAADNAVNTVTNATVQYSMQKRVKDPWNFIIGSQFQLNKHFMIRAELGFLGSRTQYLAGVQYRFGL